MKIRFKGHLNHYALSGDVLFIVDMSLKNGISYNGYYYSNGDILSNSIINGEHSKVFFGKNSLRLQAKYDVMPEKNLYVEVFMNLKTRSGYIYLPFLGKLKVNNIVMIKKEEI